MSFRVHPTRVLTLAALFVPFGSAAQSVPSQKLDTDRVAVLRVFALPGYRVRSFEHAPSGEIVLDPTAALSAVTLASDVSGPCSSSLQAPAVDVSGFGGKASASWRVEGTLVSTEGERATIDVRWHRRVHRHGALTEGETTREQRVTLRDGASGILDVVRAARDAQGTCESFAVGIELRFRSFAQEVGDAGIGYDLWLVDRSSADPAGPARARTAARHDQQAPYVFPPLRLSSADGVVTLNVSGAVTGRARADGTIELSVDTWQAYAKPAGGGFGSGGRKRLVVSSGETIELELPDKLVAKLPPDIRRHVFGLRVTAERLW